MKDTSVFKSSGSDTDTNADTSKGVYGFSDVEVISPSSVDPTNTFRVETTHVHVEWCPSHGTYGRNLPGVAGGVEDVSTSRPLRPLTHEGDKGCGRQAKENENPLVKELRRDGELLIDEQPTTPNSL